MALLPLLGQEGGGGSYDALHDVVMNIKASDPLKRIEEQLRKCVKCGACRASCPAFAVYGRETAVARGKVALARHMAEDDLACDEHLRQAMSRCLLCGSCVEKCPNDVPTDEIIIAARASLARRLGLTSFHAVVGQVIRRPLLMRLGALMASLFAPLLFRKVPATSGLRLRFPMPFVGGRRFVPAIAARPFIGRFPEVIPGQPGRPTVVFFVGCMANFVYTGVAEAAVALLRHAGCTVIIPQGQQCCGLPSMSGGDLATVCDLAERNLQELERHQADYVMTACATCGGALHRLYPRVVGKCRPELQPRLEALAAKTVDACQLLENLGLELPGDFGGEELRVTCHDPCHLRTRGLTAPPRNLMQRANGLEFVEMAHADQCCGMGGTFNVYHYDASLAINQTKSSAIIASGAQVVATGCPGCMLQLSDGLKQHGSSVRVMHTLELLAARLGKGLK